MGAVVLGFEHGFGFSILIRRESSAGAQNGFAMERRRLRLEGDSAQT